MRLVEEEFGLKVINNCHSKSNVYGFILYSEINYNVVKAMRDVDFIDALHVISGPNWPIFFVSPLQKKIDQFLGTRSNDVIEYMSCVSKETKYNKSALEFFGLNSSTKDLPCFIVFSINGESQIEQKAYRIHGKTEDDVKQSIETIVKTIADMESTIRNGSIDNYVDSYVYWEVTKKLDQLEAGNLIRKSLPGVGSVAAFISIINRLFFTK